MTIEYEILKRSTLSGPKRITSGQKKDIHVKEKEEITKEKIEDMGW